LSLPSITAPANIDYTSLDFAAFMQSLLAYAPQAMPNWNPAASEGDFGVVMLELMSYVGDVLSYYGSRISQEAYLPTATQRVSLLNIAAALGYTPYGPIPATGSVTFATPAGGTAVTVPAGTQVTANVTPSGLTEPPVYETQADVVVPASGGTASVAVAQGITSTLQQLGVSDGTAGQSFSVPSLDVETDSTLAVYVQSAVPGQNVLWNQVDALIDAASSAHAYTVSTDDTGVTWVTFGDNVNGEIPGNDLTIYVTYRVIVGSDGNLPAGAVGLMFSPITGVSVALEGDGVTPMSTAMTGGSDPESNDSIRKNASLAFTAQDRAVSLDDFTNLAYDVPGVLMANATGVHSTSVALYIAGPNYAAPSAALTDAVLAFFETRTSIGVSLSVLPPAIIPIDVGSISNPVQLVVKDGYSQAAVQQNVTTALQLLLSPPSVGFGQLLTVSDVYAAVLGVDGVAYCVIPVITREDTTQANDAPIQLRPSEFPNAGSLNFSTSGGY
jgi:uncharacterized phage protein gp47/JayE